MIVVTTPTGNIGRRVVRGLLDRGAPVRVIARDPSRLPDDVRDRVEVVPGSHADFDVVSKAFAGADSVFWVVAPNRQATDVHAAYAGFTEAASRAVTEQGARRVVGVSALGRGSAVAGQAGLVTASLAMDDLIAGTGVHYRSLTMPSFMDNVLRQVEPIRDHGVFVDMVSGDRKLPTCATHDIAAIALDLLLDDSWQGSADVPVLGPEDLSHNDMAEIMTEVLGRPVRYLQVPEEAFRARLVEIGMSAPFADGMVEMMRAKDNGLDNAEPRTPESTTPTTFRQWCEEVLKPAVG
ncbi:NAD(P)H-binding protein [Actinosynnema sp. CA-248983]